MAKSIEKSVDRNGIPLSLTKRNARGTRDERTTRVSVREWYAKRITCNVSRCVSVLEERIVRVSRVAINARKKRVNSAATFYFPLVSIPLRSRFRGTGRVESSTTNENAFERYFWRFIFIWRFSYSFPGTWKRFMEEWEIHRMLIYNTSKYFRLEAIERFSFHLTQTSINLINQSRFLSSS